MKIWFIFAAAFLGLLAPAAAQAQYPGCWYDDSYRGVKYRVCDDNQSSSRGGSQSYYNDRSDGRSWRRFSRGIRERERPTYDRRYGDRDWNGRNDDDYRQGRGGNRQDYQHRDRDWNDGDQDREPRNRQRDRDRESRGSNNGDWEGRNGRSNNRQDYRQRGRESRGSNNENWSDRYRSTTRQAERHGSSETRNYERMRQRQRPRN